MENAAIDTFAVKAGLVEGPQARTTWLEASLPVSELGLTRGDRVLDLPCGNGRHAAVLAELGIRVTAVDIDPLTIAAARAGAAHPNIAYHVSDVRSFLPTNRTYDAVISFFSCLGYLEDEAEDRAAIAALASLMRPGAGLLLSTANRVAIARVPETTSRFRFGSYEIARKDRYCAQTGYLTRLYTITDKMRATQETIIHRRRLYGPEEVRAMFEAAGLTLFRTYSDFTCGAFDRTCSSHAVYFSRLRELVI